MNAMADVKVMKTAAETALAQTFAQARERLPGDAAVAAKRAAAFGLFAKEGLPHRRVEDWKYTDLRALMREAKPLASPPDAAAKARGKTAGMLVGDIDCRRLVFVDGAFVPELSDTAALETGLSVLSLAAALADGDPAADGKTRQARAVERCRGRAQHRADGRRRRDPYRRRCDHRAAAASHLRRLGDARRDLRAVAGRGRAGRARDADRKP